jgi:hypothetical protein
LKAGKSGFQYHKKVKNGGRLLQFYFFNIEKMVSDQFGKVINIDLI